MEYNWKEPKPNNGILRRTLRIYGENMGGILLFSVLLGGLPLILQCAVAMAVFPELFRWPGWRTLFYAFQAGQFEMIPPFLESFSINGPNYVLRGLGASLLFSLSGLIGSVLLRPFVTGGITNIAAGWMHGVRKTAGQWFAATQPFYGRLIVTGLCYTLVDVAFSIIFSTLSSLFFVVIAVGGFAAAALPNMTGIAFVLMPVMAFLFAFAVYFVYYAFRGLLYPVAVGEGLYYFRAVAKALRLARRNMGRCLGVMLLTSLLMLLWTLACIAGCVLLVVLGGAPLVVGVGTAIVLLVPAWSLPLIAFTVLYDDLRAGDNGPMLENQ